MQSQRRDRHQARARVLKALAHPSRLIIVEALANGERCVGDLTALVGDDTSTVSKHLSVLRGAGLVLDRKDGNKVNYSLRVPCVLHFFECIDLVLSAAQPATQCCTCQERVQ